MKSKTFWLAKHFNYIIQRNLSIMNMLTLFRYFLTDRLMGKLSCLRVRACNFHCAYLQETVIAVFSKNFGF